MLIHFIEGADATRHVHRAGCGDLVFQLQAGEVWELELPDDSDEDDILTAVWEDFLEGEAVDEEALNTFDEMTVWRACVLELLPPAEDEAESSGNEKADEFMDDAEDAGWSVEFEVVDGLTTVTATRAQECIDIAWEETRFHHCVYGLLNGEFKNLHSAGAARKQLTSKAQTLVTQGVDNGHTVKRLEPVKRTLRQVIPFDLDEAYDDEIIAACRGKWIVWWNTLAEDYERAFCIGKNHIRIETGAAGRAILTFVSPEGFRSVALEELVQVK